MQIFHTAAIAVGLGLDAMSVCAAIGVRWHGPGQKFRLAWHMGLFQFLMPLLGWLVGRQIAALLCGVGTYIAAGMLLAIAAKMFYEAWKARPGSLEQRTEEKLEHAMHLSAKDPTRGLSLYMLSVATSIDALVVGFSLALKGQAIWQVSLIIGVVAAVMALIGVTIGQRLGKAFGCWAELAGAVVLTALAISFLVL